MNVQHILHIHEHHHTPRHLKPYTQKCTHCETSIVRQILSLLLHRNSPPTLTWTLKFQIHYQRQSFTSATHLFCHKHKNAPCRCELHNTIQQPIPFGSSNCQHLHNLRHISIGFTDISLKDKTALQTLKHVITQRNAYRR